VQKVQVIHCYWSYRGKGSHVAYMTVSGSVHQHYVGQHLDNKLVVKLLTCRKFVYTKWKHKHVVY